MKPFPRGAPNCRRLTFLMLAVFSVSAPHASAQGVKLPDPAGTEIFRRLLYDNGCKPLSDFPDLGDSPSDKVLIILGDATRLEHWGLQARGLEKFVDAGGSALVATDRIAGGAALAHFRTLVNAFLADVNPGSGASYRDGDGLFIQPVRGAALFRSGERELRRVAAIQPSQLYVEQLLLEPYANLPRDARVSQQRMEQRDNSGPGTFAQGSDSFGAGNGRILIIADHSVFSNGLVWQRKGPAANDNYEFALNCVDWLTENGKRKQVLFIENGRIIEDFFTSFIEEPTPPLPRIEDVVQAVNQGLDGIQQEDRFNDWIGSLARDVQPRVVLVVVTIALAALGLIRLGQAKYYAETGVPTLSTGLTQLVPSVSLVTQRKRWLLRSGNFAEVAQALGQEFFASIGVLESVGLPDVRVRASWLKNRRLKRNVRWVWRLANGEQSERISARRLAKLRRVLGGLRAALAQDTLQLSARQNP